MDEPPELAIRRRRAAFNRALAEADPDAIASLLAPNVVLVAGTDSALIAGRKAQLVAWRREFAAPERAVYRRLPETITLSPIAFEQGKWQSVASAGGRLVAHGVYTAKWRQIGDDWTIEAELFLTLG